MQAADEVDPPAEEPQELTSEQVERSVTRYWKEITAKGYGGFATQGRGALPAKLAWNEVTGIYLPAPAARKLAEMVTAYNPERELVVCVANPA